MNPELFKVAAGFLGMGLVIGIGWALDVLFRPAGAHRAQPRGERVPAVVALEAVAPYVGFHDRPLTISPATVAADWGHCTECTARRYGQVLEDGSFVCVEGHHTPAGEAL
jgi:hypothetical protein